MKQITLTVIAVMTLLAVAACANELAFNSAPQTGNTCFEVNLSKSFDKHFGLSAYAAQTIGWHEYYTGPTYANANYQVGVAAGHESGQSSTRLGAFLWTGKDRVSFLALGEDGGSGEWYRLEGKYKLDSKTTLGILSAGAQSKENSA